MSILLYVNSCLALLFSFLLIVQNISFISIFATILGMGYAFLLLFFSIELLKKKTQRSFWLTRSLSAYLVVVMMIVFMVSRLSGQTHELMDIILGILWFILAIIMFATMILLNPKRAEKYFGITVEKKKKSIVGEILSWVDAIAWTISHLILVNMFVLQLYEIPSESMVPTFMIKDRVVSLKIASGPKFPLSSFYLPRLVTYKRGDVVVLKSHRYPSTIENEWKTLWSQAVSMLTLMKVNLDVDPLTGRQKADPLVKRIVGLPGERLMLVDGVLYVKSSADVDYHPVTEDSQYAAWNLNDLSAEEKTYIKDLVFSNSIYNEMLDVEEKRKAVQFRTEYDEIEKILHSTRLQKNFTDTDENVSQFLLPSENSVINLFTNNVDIARRIATTNGGLNWLAEFSLSWADFWVSAEASATNLYEFRNAQLSVLIKKVFAQLMLRNLQLFAQNSTEVQIQEDEQRLELLTEAERYIVYLQLSNGRNMDEFPKDSYLGNDEYFLMGDNRFNSLDMRHTLTKKSVPLDNYDSMPVYYDSQVFPETLPGKKILGLVNLIFYPFNRAKIMK